MRGALRHLPLTDALNVKVVSADEFADHLQELEDKGNTGEAVGGEHATTTEGLEDAESGANE